MLVWRKFRSYIEHKDRAGRCVLWELGDEPRVCEAIDVRRDESGQMAGLRRTMFVMRIGVDIDDVIAECAAPYLRAFAKEFGLDLGDAVLGWHLLDEFAEIPKEKKDEFRQSLYDGRFFGDLECYPDCADALPRLVAAGHEVHFITARSERRRRITTDWLETKGLLRYAATLQLKPIGDFVPRAYDASGSGEYKASVARRLGLERFCEDDPVVARRLAEENVTVFLFDRPWNAELAHPLVHRVRDWDQVVRELAADAGRDGD